MDIILAAAAAFVATNIDDIFILMIYFTQVNRTFRPKHIVQGQFIGFGAILLVSAIGFFGALVIPEAWIGLLGFFPIYMGIRSLLKGRQEAEQEEIAEITETQRSGRFASLFNPQVYGVAAVTFANGGDNISVYIPLFAGQSVPGVGAIVVVFALGLALWCYLGYRLGNQPTLATIIRRYGHFIVPFVLIGLGIFILHENGSIEMLLGLFGVHPA